mmetsp:Transcript_14012/g.21865  ORF Transcript_14012/g.21865 Transcript_14012/m.21865 type:complete len:214 (-) Transcript_14012:195-836(-)|eukprot:CAMPEP_0195291688 /NCGR_PEP_ID=MMETSP0707-20130614/8061_1 /TAXON_ID=33640 /ORGANISM="Asterionellopsis glacialis, Strain CCMP134" /LENGTH=213 /DNA_ID=CAMNT_0040352027 /DNA_START=87 /DNA_END=728 /DNA_ORIENTATION=-
MMKSLAYITTRRLVQQSTQKSFVPAISTAWWQQSRLFSKTSVTYDDTSSRSSSKLAERVERVLAVKAESGKTFDDLANEVGVTNTYIAQIMLGQAKLTAHSAIALKQALPDLSDSDLDAMQQNFPFRSFDDSILKEPNVYRTYEAVTHYGEAIKRIINEQCGDGIMSAIDFYLDVGTTTGKHGEKRVVITFNGKFLPHIEQKLEDNGAKSPRD